MTRLNGQEMQQLRHRPADLSVPQIVAFCSDFTTLAPGDVIATGTPEGVGHRRNPPLWMKPGDVLEVEITASARCAPRRGRDVTLSAVIVRESGRRVNADIERRADSP